MNSVPFAYKRHREADSKDLRFKEANNVFWVNTFRIMTEVVILYQQYFYLKSQTEKSESEGIQNIYSDTKAIKNNIVVNFVFIFRKMYPLM